jgi:hypothetical protein
VGKIFGEECFMKRFKILEEQEVKDAYKFQQDEKHYTFYEERGHVESVFNNRFNFLFITYGLFMNIFFLVTTKLDKLILLYIGGTITLLLSLTIWRTYLKLDIVLNMLYSLGEKHSFPMIDKELKGYKSFKFFPVLPILAIVIPWLLIISFVIAIVAVQFGLWKL